MRQWTGSALVQVMACRLFGAKPSPKPMLVYSQMDSWQQISVKFKSEFYHFHWRKCIWNCHLPIWRPFCPGGEELKYSWWVYDMEVISTLLALREGNHQWLVDFPHKGPVMQFFIWTACCWSEAPNSLFLVWTRQIRTPVLRIPPSVTSQAKMKNWLHECQKWVSHMIGQYAHI